MNHEHTVFAVSLLDLIKDKAEDISAVVFLKAVVEAEPLSCHKMAHGSDLGMFQQADSSDIAYISSMRRYRAVVDLKRYPQVYKWTIDIGKIRTKQSVQFMYRQQHLHTP